jgi:alanyl-tRNA synthetase
VKSTGDIGAFKITDISALSAGHRRITAVTGPKAIELFQQVYDTVKQLSQEFKVQKEEVLAAVNKQRDEVKQLHHKIKQLKKIVSQAQIPQLLSEAETVRGIPFLAITIANATNEELKEIAQTLNTKKPGFYFLASGVDDKGIFVAMVSPNFSDKLNLKNFASFLKDEFAIKGGGTGTTLQGGMGKFSTELKEGIKRWLQKELEK